jgi:hypothetical protein
VRQLDRVSIAGFIFVVQMFVFINASYIWENEDVERVFTIYFVMMAFTFAILDSKNPLYKITIFDGISQLFFAFVAGIFLFSTFNLPGSENYGGYESQALVIGIVEEFCFRGALPEAFGKGHAPADTARLLSAASFSLFHVFVYDFSVVNLAVAFVFGLIMQYVWDSKYPLASCGLHAAWNVVVLGGSFSLWAFDVALLGGI